jgi:hypothetical protein
MPFLSLGSVRRKALAERLPIRFLVYMPVAFGIGAETDIRFIPGSAGLYGCGLTCLVSKIETFG